MPTGNAALRSGASLIVRYHLIMIAAFFVPGCTPSSLRRCSSTACSTSASAFDAAAAFVAVPLPAVGGVVAWSTAHALR